MRRGSSPRSTEMRRFGWTLSRYLIKSVLPYFFFSWVLLSVILFFQQAARYSDIFFSANVPQGVVLELAIALVPSVISFTSPMAVLVGVVIGLSRMQGDSELIAIRASGVGNIQLTAPMILLGIVLSGLSFLVNSVGVPFAAGIAKRVAIESAIYELDSPIVPGTFNTGIAGFTVFVREGDPKTGMWKNIFIHTEGAGGGETRVITAATGRIDSGANVAELVLSDANVTTIPADPVLNGRISSEKVGSLRFGVKTGKADLIARLQSVDDSPETMGLVELSDYAAKIGGKESKEANILLARRVYLSLVPLLFTILGTALVLRFNRKGRGFGAVLALAGLVAYYLVSLLLEQVARTSSIDALVSGAVAPILAVIVALWLFVSTGRVRSSKRFKTPRFLSRTAELFEKVPSLLVFKRGGGFLDREILRSLLSYFVLSLGFLSAIFIIFTAFEMWKFAGSMDGGPVLLLKYLLFLLPMIFSQLVAPSLMIAALATFVIKSRQNEVVTWAAAGQSVYRLLIPCFMFMGFVAFLVFLLQETALPWANRLQDTYRAELRSRGENTGKLMTGWTATDGRIYRFSTPKTGFLRNDEIGDVSIFETDRQGGVSRIVQASSAKWEDGEVTVPKESDVVTFRGELKRFRSDAALAIEESEHPFTFANQRPTHLNLLEAFDYYPEIDSGPEKRAFGLAIHQKFATLVLPFVIVLFTVPFAISMSRSSNVIMIGYALGVWLVFTAATTFLGQLGTAGKLPIFMAAWLPILIFAMIGTVLLTRVRT